MSLPLMLRSAEREAIVWRRIWRSGAFSTFVAPVLMLVALGIGLGELVDQDTGAVGGLDYLAFITPGLMMGSVVQGAAGGSMWPVMAGHRWLGYHHAAVASPMSAADVYGGQVLWIAARGCLQTMVFLGAGVVLGGVSSWWALATVPLAALAALSFAAPLAAFAATQDSDAGFEVILRVVVMPLYLFSGTLFPVDDLPALLGVITRVFPLWHAVEVARAATTGSGEGVAVAGHLAVLVAYVAAGWWWGMQTFARRLTP